MTSPPGREWLSLQALTAAEPEFVEWVQNQSGGLMPEFVHVDDLLALAAMYKQEVLDGGEP